MRYLCISQNTPSPASEAARLHSDDLRTVAHRGGRLPHRATVMPGYKHFPIRVGFTCGNWTVIGPRCGDLYRRTPAYPCSCACGSTAVIAASLLRSGKPKGCKHCAKLRHGHAVRKRDTPTHRTWNAMLQRCSNPKNASWQCYGARGIRVCKRWHKFINFLHDMGVKPTGMSIDRRDNDGNYTKSNCRWATPKQQANNRRKPKI